jgi:hypothetical protein
VELLRQRFGRDPSREELRELVKEFRATLGPNTDRSSWRTKEGLILWLCENHRHNILQDEPITFVDPLDDMLDYFSADEFG